MIVYKGENLLINNVVFVYTTLNIRDLSNRFFLLNLGSETSSDKKFSRLHISKDST